MCRVFLPSRRAGARSVLRSALLTAVIITLGSLCAPTSARAADAILTTTELGVTVTSKELFDSLNESNNLWPTIQRHMLSDSFTTGDPATRKEAAAVISDVRSQFHDRLFGQDEAAAEDLLNYVAWSLRRARFYRELREVVGDPAAMNRLRDTWQQAYRTHVAPDKEYDVTPLLAAVRPQLDRLELPAEKHARSLELFELIGACAARMEATAAGQLIRQVDRDLGDTPTGDLVRKVVAAVDWTSIVKPADVVARKKHFLAAWDELHAVPDTTSTTVLGR
jgi:hypothetical protein